MAMVSFVQAQEISVDAARQTAAAFIRSHAAKIPQKSRKGILKAPLKAPQLRLVHTKMDAQHSAPTLYVFETQQGGYVIASADERAYPVLGYSEDGTFSEDTLNCCMKYILEQYSRQIEDARKQNLPRYVQALENDTRQNIEPLITCEWSQREPFNNLCPITSTGGHSVTGCTATAMAQIMYYHKWPEQGVGTHSYTWHNTNLSADFGNTTYRWDLMKDRYDEDLNDPEDAVATLMYHCGISADMNYAFYSSDNGSSASLSAESFEKYFNYSSIIEKIESDLENKIYDELIHQRPVPISGYPLEGDGHSYICDGYRTDGYFHFNLGWGPYGNNNYFKMTSVSGYNSERAIIKILPKNHEIKDTYGNIYVGVGGEACLMKGIDIKLRVLNIPSQVKSTDGTIYPVTEISSRALLNCNQISNITMPNAVKKIGDYAFSCCYSLTKITFPNSLTSIGRNAFDFCNITSVTIPNSVTTIGKNAFYGCGELISITIPNSVTSIGEGAFNRCYKLTDVTIPESVNKIKGYTFYECKGLKSISIPNSVTSIGDYAFNGCTGLRNITILNSVTDIGGGAFSGCESLTSIIIPNSVTSIGNSLFYNCTGLTNITIPNSVTSIGNSAFAYCYNLTNITIPNSVTSIGTTAFQSCKRLKSVTIPNSVTNIGYRAFYDCNSLTSIYAFRTNPSEYKTASHDTFGDNSDIYSNCILYVPIGSKEAYEKVSPWKYFTNIVEMDITGIKDISSDLSVRLKEYYKPDGQRIAQPQSGVNIIRYSDGTSRKMLVK